MQQKKPGLVPVYERLKRMQAENYRTVPIRPKKQEEKSVEKELEEFKNKAWISPVKFENTKVRERLEKIKSEPLNIELDIKKEPQKSVPDEDLENNPILQKIKLAMGKVDDIKKKMVGSDKFLSYYYDLKKAEQNLRDAIAEAEKSGIVVPSSLKLRAEALLERRKFA